MVMSNIIGSAVLIGAVAFGSSAIGAVGLVSTAPTCQDEQGNIIACPGDPPPGGDTTGNPPPPPTDGTGAGTGTTEQPKPDPKPAMELVLSNVERGVKVDWSRCGSRHSFYAIVRSTDETVTWPVGENDKLVGAVWHRNRTVWIDRHAPAGTTVWYRVFCLSHRTHHHGYKVVNSSPAVAIETPGGSAGG